MAARRARPAPAENDYRELKRRAVGLGLLDPQPRYYLRVFTLTYALFFLPYALIFVVGGYWWAVGLGVLAAFASGQVGLAAHDLGHGQTPRLRPFVFDLAACFTMLVLGMSRAWWVDKHNRHHAFPNQEGKDPDVMIEAIALTPEQALEKKGLMRLLARYQAFLFFPLLMFEAVHLRVEGLRYLSKHAVRIRRVEIALILLSIGWALALPIAALGLGAGLVFAVVTQALTGLYLGCIFAPNLGLSPVERELRSNPEGGGERGGGESLQVSLDAGCLVERRASASARRPRRRLASASSLSTIAMVSSCSPEMP